MRLLLDTHVLLWALTDDARLSPRARKLLNDESNALHFSVVSLWEIAIKHALGRGDMPISAAAAAGHCEEAGYSLVPMTAQHVLALEPLPALHTDPFDRMLVAQALTEPLRLLTHDEGVARYSDSVILI